MFFSIPIINFPLAQTWSILTSLPIIFYIDQLDKDLINVYDLIDLNACLVIPKLLNL